MSAGKGITIRGTHYRDVKQAAEALGVTKHAIYNARYRGLLDTVGLGRHGGLDPIEVTYAGITWPSIVAMCKDLGIKHSSVYASRSVGSVKLEEKLERLAQQFKEQQQQ